LTAGPQEPFRCEVRREDASVLLEVAGELDLATAAAVEEHLEAASGDGTRAVVVDLRGVTFMDSSGLRMLLKADVAARRDGWRLSLVPGPEPVMRVFELTGVAGRFTFVPSAR
jgi:anti-anti-sigma factor